jgi:NAD(P)-dependent dehydrogenase (short-subunit alcohol dehydrogenase family)
MDSDPGPTVIAGSDASVVGDLARLVPPASTVVTVAPEQPAAPAADVLASGTAGGWDRAAAEVERTWGTPRMVVIAPAPVARTGLADLAGPDWSSALDRNLGTAAAACRAFAPSLARRPAAVRPLASIVLVTWRNAPGPGAVHLAAVAGAVRLFALALAADLGPSGITVNAVTVAEDDLAAAGPAVDLLSSPDAGYLTAEVLAPRSGPGGRR